MNCNSIKISIAKTFSLILFLSFCTYVSFAQVDYVKQKGGSYKINYMSDYHNKGLSLFGTLSFNNQSINDAGINAPVNYLYNSVNNNTYKPGYSAGIRWDGLSNRNKYYTLSMAINRVSTGVNYQNKHTLAPFIEDFTHFKADNQYTTLSIAAHLNKLLPINDMRDYKFFLVAGPSIDYKISEISNENLLNGTGYRTIINGDLGVEFDNKGYYVLYAHYKLGANLFQSTVPVRISRFDIGMSIKVKDLF